MTSIVITIMVSAFIVALIIALVAKTWVMRRESLLWKERLSDQERTVFDLRNQLKRQISELANLDNEIFGERGKRQELKKAVSDIYEKHGCAPIGGVGVTKPDTERPQKDETVYETTVSPLGGGGGRMGGPYFTSRFPIKIMCPSCGVALNHGCSEGK